MNFFSAKNDLKRTFSVKIKEELEQKPTQKIEEKVNFNKIIEEKENNKDFANKFTGIFEKKRLSAMEKLQKSLNSNLYQVLQISPYADLQDIKKAYKKLSLKMHPDKNKSATKEEFHQIVYAYKILGNTELRKIYDEQGLEVTEMVMSVWEGNGNNSMEEMKF